MGAPVLRTEANHALDFEGWFHRLHKLYHELKVIERALEAPSGCLCGCMSNSTFTAAEKDFLKAMRAAQAA